MGKDVVYTISN